MSSHLKALFPILAFFLVVGYPAIVEAETDPNPANQAPAEEDTSSINPEASMRLLVQAGIWYQVSGQIPMESPDNPFLLTWDLGAFRWDGRSRTWGLGVRGAMDDFGFRLGPKVFMRWPLGSQGSSFVQLGMTVYVFSGNGDMGNPPGLSSEVEIAPSGWISLALGVEAVKYTEHWMYTSPTEETNTSFYAGAKMGGWTGLAVTAVIFALAAGVASGNGN